MTHALPHANLLAFDTGKSFASGSTSRFENGEQNMGNEVITSRRNLIKWKLHEKYSLHEFDNSDVWSGNTVVLHGDLRLTGHIIRLFVGSEPISFQVEVELYIREITDSGPLDYNDVDAVVWTDANTHGFLDEEGRHFPDPGTCVPMGLKKDGDGNFVMRGNNAVFISEPITISKTGVFNFTTLFSGDGAAPSMEKKWIAVNDIAHQRDEVLVVVPEYIKSCPSVMEICVRKYGASIVGGNFVSGTIRNITNDLKNIPADILYLLPFFEPGTGDILEGGDVRKGTLGSVYAIKDFFRIDPAICTPLRDADIKDLASKNLIRNEDLEKTSPSGGIKTVHDILSAIDNQQIIDAIGIDAATQLVGKADLRTLASSAHALGKKVIFDLVLMQTSRDSQLIIDHRNWYELDEEGLPKRHKIAWLDYSDVALFDLKNNKDLRDYIGGVAPYWIKSCDLDGVRIDASQTVFPAFMKQIKNRINEVKPEALVLGETLCPLSEALEVPADMIYSLFVDHHVGIDHATPYYDLMEKYHNLFPTGTVALAYFENHDSARASLIWQKKFATLVKDNPAAKETWTGLLSGKHAIPEAMAAMKNIQCSAINCFSGTADAVNFSCMIENGTDFGETVRTDFENETIIDFSKRKRGLGALLHNAYTKLFDIQKATNLVESGHVFYFRHNMAGGDNRVFCLVRHRDGNHLLLLANLDPSASRIARFSFSPLGLLPDKKYIFNTAFNSFVEFGLSSAPISSPPLSGRFLSEGLAEFHLQPLQTIILTFSAQTS